MHLPAGGKASLAAEQLHKKLGTEPDYADAGGAAVAQGAKQVAAAKAQVQGGGQAFGNEIHVLVTSNGSPYLNFQTRMMYGTYKKVKDLPGSELRYFTRLLHRTKDDILVGEVPTVRVDPLTPKCDEWCEFPVSDRPNAVVKWLQTEDANKGTHILMIETDYVWLKPLAVPPAMRDSGAVSYHFTYISPRGTKKNMDQLWQTEFAGQDAPEDVPPTGPAPAIVKTDDLRRIAPYWERFTAAIEASEEHKKRLGWVREMYAYSLAASAAGITHHTARADQGSPLIAQPPSDPKPYDAAMLHYTWGTQFKDPKDGNKVVWEFDKRGYTAADLVTNPRELPMPPQDITGLTQQFPRNGMKVDPDTRETLALMIGKMNEVLRELPPL